VRVGRSGSKEVDHRLFAILKVLASLLISSGYGVARVNAAIRRAYVEAASSLQTKGGRPISNARIAALTGLTRTEVTKLQRARGRADLLQKHHSDRAKRVTSGWVADQEFCNSRGQPKILPYLGKIGSFNSLVKRHSGDIPARAMLSEMERLKLVRRRGIDDIELLKMEAPISRHTIQSLRAVSMWIESLKTLSSGFTSGDIETSAKTINLSFSSLPQAHSALRELEKRRRAFEQTILGLSTEKSKNNSFQLTISIALAAALPKNLGKISPRKGVADARIKREHEIRALSSTGGSAASGSKARRGSD
jgi:hypothetical protein